MIHVDRTKVLTPQEYTTILDVLHQRAERSHQWQATLTIFRLAAGCGLRASEIAGLCIGDVHCDEEYPFLHVRALTAKRGKARSVPLTWDEDTTNDIRDWKQIRVENHGDDAGDPFVCSLYGDNYGSPLDRLRIRQRFITAVRAALGKERAARVTVHHGRHTYATLALRGGISLPEVQEAMGHSSSSITSAYLHVLPEDRKRMRNVFKFEEAI